MDCMSMDTICELQQDLIKYVEEVKIEQDIKDKTFSLVVIDGKEYIFSEIDGQSTITIVTSKKPVFTQMF